jgi:hypothetical protein
MLIPHPGNPIKSVKHSRFFSEPILMNIGHEWLPTIAPNSGGSGFDSRIYAWLFLPLAFSRFS